MKEPWHVRAQGKCGDGTTNPWTPWSIDSNIVVMMVIRGPVISDGEPEVGVLSVFRRRRRRSGGGG